MNRNLLFVAVMLLGMQTMFAQTNVTVVNADYDTDEFAKIQIALDDLNSADYTITVIDTIANYSDISGADLVLFYKGNDNIGKDIWDANSSTLVLTEHMLAYTEAGGVLWLDGIEILYSAYEDGPEDFAVGHFINDIFGVSKYASQSVTNDALIGVSDFVKDENATIMTVESITWDYSTLYWVDGLEITTDASPLYRMGGGPDYPLKGQVTALYKENFIFSGFRLGKMNVQDDLNQLILDVLTAAKAGSFAKTTSWNGSDYYTGSPLSIDINNATKFGIFPNPSANGFVTIQTQNNESLTNIEVFNTLGKSMRSISVDQQSKISFDVNGLTQGIYFVRATTKRGVATQKLVVK